MPYVLALVLTLLAPALRAQQATDRLRTMPGYDAVQRLRSELALHPATPFSGWDATWAADSRSFVYTWDGKAHRFDVDTKRETDATATGRPAARPQPTGGCPPTFRDRGRQSACEPSPDGSKHAMYRDRNLYLADASGGHETAVATGGTDANRIKYGVASWVYGEELDQTTAMWWSPDGKKIAFYRFDESRVADYYIQTNQTQIHDGLDVEAYPKAGADNPVADVLVYDLGSGRTTTLDVRDGQPFQDEVLGYYVYAMQWSADGRELRVNRTDRRQHVMDLAGCDVATGKCRTIVREEWPTGWAENRPAMRPLTDGKRFVWGSSRTGFLNYYLYDLSGKLLATLTNEHAFDAGEIVRIDERAGVMFYLARDGDNFLKMQLHRVGLDGKGDVRLTDPAFNHSVRVSPDGRYFVDLSQAHDRAPVLRLVNRDGATIAEVATTNLARWNELHLRTPEYFTYKAADGQTTLMGSIMFPTTFDASKTYPVLVSVYGGPEDAGNTPSETFTAPNANAEYGFLYVNVESRAIPGLGRHVLDGIYRKLGQTEIDDIAAGVRAAAERPYVDKSRIGIYGTSYGGYASLMEILRYPDLFAAASASSPATDWRNYDTIYTERYMGLPQENEEGYTKGSPMTYASALRGRLLIYYGTADNNVHPANSLQLIQALTGAGKSFEVQVGADQGHSAVDAGRMMEFFVENLILRPDRLRAPAPKQ